MSWSMAWLLLEDIDRFVRANNLRGTANKVNNKISLKIRGLLIVVYDILLN